MGKSVDDDGFLFGALPYNAPAHGCSVIFYPPAATEHGGGVLSRFYDFSTGTLRGRTPPEGQLPATARPWFPLE